MSCCCERRANSRIVDDILNVGLADRNGVPVYVRDIATVEDSHEDVRYMVGVNGKPAVRMFIYKQSGANTVRCLRRRAPRDRADPA